ncbi:MAG TPA: ABC transporter permease [Candidatus Hydrogenedentes bacterium]|nr:ABC transporter permease [Candidatus Hydrogenedentota bacterium]HOS04087.1 ABC transporter permease [Candidatus Hydrogenedentota bacterium]
MRAIPSSAAGPRDLGRATVLLSALVSREFKSRYRRSMLGPLWAVIQPLVYMLLFLFLGTVLKMASPKGPYVVYLFCALMPWTFFANAVTRCASSLISNASIVKKIAVPREVFPLSVVIVSLLDFLISLVVLFGLLAYYQIAQGIPLASPWACAFWLPILTLLTFMLASGIGLALAAFGTYRYDVFFAVPLLLQAWMFATPIFYLVDGVPMGLRSWYSLNPMVGIVEAYRSVLMYGQSPDLSLLAVAVIVTIVIWALVWPVFRYVSQYFADVL